MTAELFSCDDPRMTAALAIRFAVFVDEQRVPVEEEVDEHDRTDGDAVHALVRDDAGTPIATGRFYVLDTRSVQIGRMAVTRAARGSGAGRVVLGALCAEAARRGFTRASLHAQDHAVGFYAKAGFTPYGETMVECEIVHQPMESTLA